MITFITFSVFTLFIAVMSLGVILMNKEIKGSCGNCTCRKPLNNS